MRRASTPTTSALFLGATGFRLLSRLRRLRSCSVKAAGLLVVLLAGCSPEATLDERIPATVKAGEMTWTRGPAQPLAMSGLGKDVGQGSSFVYSGIGGITVHVIEMKSEASAFEAHRPRVAAPNKSGTRRTWPRHASPLCASSFEARQGWRTTPGMAPAQKGNLFFVVGFEQPETAQKFMTAFLDQVKK